LTSLLKIKLEAYRDIGKEELLILAKDLNFTEEYNLISAINT
jgi:hypothetical protein